MQNQQHAVPKSTPRPGAPASAARVFAPAPAKHQDFQNSAYGTQYWSAGPVGFVQFKSLAIYFETLALQGHHDSGGRRGTMRGNAYLLLILQESHAPKSLIA